jgi:2-polyprenyl-3-methyl-5-hydroxy-6-metoxy-1,4-benzoquinol methylase
MPSRCLTEPRQPQAAVPYLRNKNIEIHPRERGWGQRLWGRVLRYVAARHQRALLGDDPQVVLSEQLVENAVVLANLPAGTRKVLDFGGVESLLPVTLAALGYEVTVWDQRPYAFAHPSITTVRRDLFEGPPPGMGPFDLVISISTVEHLGFGSYGDVTLEDADASGVAALWSMVKPGGRMICTVPAGRAAIHRGFRVYDRQRIARVFPSPRTACYFLKEGRDAVWRRADEAEVQRVEYEAPSQPLPVDAVAVLIFDK